MGSYESYDYVLEVYSSQHSEILYRADDGIAIGQRKNCVVVFGEEPNKKSSRVFIDEEHAAAYLVEQVTIDDFSEQYDAMPIGALKIHRIDKEGLVVPVGEMIDLPGKMSRM